MVKLFAKIGVDTAEYEPLKVPDNMQANIHVWCITLKKTNLHVIGKLRSGPRVHPRVGVLRRFFRDDVVEEQQGHNVDDVDTEDL